MFTGIITHLGTVYHVERMPEQGMKVQIKISASGITLGDSVACDGVCLTVSKQIATDIYEFHVSQETRALTTLPSWTSGYICNIELPLTVGDRIGGHFVTGHIDGMAKIISLKQSAADLLIACRIQSTKGTAQWVSKGSIAINGVSLTISHIEGDICQVCIVPHTGLQTNLAKLNINQLVNIEFDMFCKIINARFKQYQEAQ